MTDCTIDALPLIADIFSSFPFEDLNSKTSDSVSVSLLTLKQHKTGVPLLEVSFFRVVLFGVCVCVTLPNYMSESLHSIILRSKSNSCRYIDKDEQHFEANKYITLKVL
jgi:hypothetical protein